MSAKASKSVLFRSCRMGHCRSVAPQRCPASSVGASGPLHWPWLRGGMVQQGLLRWHPALSRHSGKWPYASLDEACVGNDGSWYISVTLEMDVDQTLGAKRATELCHRIL